MRRSTILSVTASLMVLAAASAASAQTELATGQTREGALEATDPVAPGWGDGAGHHSDDYRITAGAGQRLEAIMRSSVFDTYLTLYRDGAVEAGQELRSDDDGLGDGTDSRLRFTVEDAGVYVLRARSFGDEEIGPYNLTLNDRGQAPRAPRPERARIGATLTGDLSDGDPETDIGSAYDAYVLRLGEGERVAARMTSEAFDPVLRISRDGDWRELAMNDDSGLDGLNSYLLFTAPEAGDYVVRAGSFGEEGRGDYVLTIETPPPPAPATPMTIGDTIQGDLAETDATDDLGMIYDGYRFSGRAGSRVSIAMSSEDFDTYLVLGRDGPGGFEALIEDDDGAGEGLNSRIVHTLDADGEYEVRARAFGGGYGAYSLSLEETVPLPPAQPLAFGPAIQDEITPEDPIDDMGRHYDAWAIAGQAGQRMQAVMRSGDFDTYVEIGRAGDVFEALASDDDGLGEGLDSRLNFTFPETGDYVLRASPLGGEATGLYSLELSDRGPEPAPGSLVIGATTRGQLDDLDSTAGDGSFYDAYRFQARAGDRLRITMVSNEFDALVVLGREDETGAFESIASDDDSLSDTHSKLDHVIDEAGTYVIRAGSFGPGGEGGYSMTLERRQDP